MIGGKYSSPDFTGRSCLKSKDALLWNINYSTKEVVPINVPWNNLQDGHNFSTTLMANTMFKTHVMKNVAVLNSVTASPPATQLLRSCGACVTLFLFKQTLSKSNAFYNHSHCLLESFVRVVGVQHERRTCPHAHTH